MVQHITPIPPESWCGTAWNALSLWNCFSQTYCRRLYNLDWSVWLTRMSLFCWQVPAFLSQYNHIFFWCSSGCDRSLKYPHKVVRLCTAYVPLVHRTADTLEGFFPSHQGEEAVIIWCLCQETAWLWDQFLHPLRYKLIVGCRMWPSCWNTATKQLGSQKRFITPDYLGVTLLIGFGSNLKHEVGYFERRK